MNAPVMVAAGLTVGAAVFKAAQRVSAADEAERQLRLQKVASQQTIRAEKENEKRRAALRQTQLNALQAQTRVTASALGVIGGPSLAAINATLAHGATLEQAWDAAQTARNVGTLRMQISEQEGATDAFTRNQYLGIAGDAFGAAVDVIQLARMGEEADDPGKLPLGYHRKAPGTAGSIRDARTIVGQDDE